MNCPQPLEEVLLNRVSFISDECNIGLLLNNYNYLKVVVLAICDLSAALLLSLTKYCCMASK